MPKTVNEITRLLESVTGNIQNLYNERRTLEIGNQLSDEENLLNLKLLHLRKSSLSSMLIDGSYLNMVMNSALAILGKGKESYVVRSYDLGDALSLDSKRLSYMRIMSETKKTSGLYENISMFLLINFLISAEAQVIKENDKKLLEKFLTLKYNIIYLYPEIESLFLQNAGKLSPIHICANSNDISMISYHKATKEIDAILSGNQPSELKLLRILYLKTLIDNMSKEAIEQLQVYYYNKHRNAACSPLLATKIESLLATYNRKTDTIKNIG